MLAHDRFGQRKDRAGTGVRAAFAAVAALVLMMCVAVAMAFEPADGTEFLWTNATGTTLVGYGRVWDGALEIELSGDGRQLRVLMIGPDGTVVDLGGEVRGGRPFLDIAGRGMVDLAQLLSESGLSLVMRYDDGATQVLAPVGADEADGLPGGADDTAEARDEAPSEERPGPPEDREPLGDRPGPPEDRAGPPDDPGRGPPEDRAGPPEDRPGPPEDPGRGPPEDRPGPPEDPGRGPPEDRPGPPEDPGRGPPEELPGPPEDPGRGPPEELPRNPEDLRPPFDRPVEPEPESHVAPIDDGAGHERDASRRGTPDPVVMA